MKIFVISLISDEVRRENLKMCFPKMYSTFNFVNAVDKNQVDLLIDHINVKSLKVPISQVEIACALSHSSIYKKIVLNNLDSCLILEDDIIGSDQDIDKVVEIYRKLPKNSILLAGGMDGMKSMNYLYGELVYSHVYRIHPAYYQFLVRACCYVIPKSIAAKILAIQEKSIIRADEWGEFLKNENNVYFSPIFHHPLDLTHSHIEISRRTELNGVFKRLFREGFFFTGYKMLKRNMLKLYAKFKGLKAVFK